MKKSLIPFLMTLVVAVPFSSNTLVADSQAANPICDLQEENAWSARLNELKDAGGSEISEEEFIKLANFFISESDQVIVADLREEGDGLPENWTDGFHGLYNQTAVKLEEKENECLREALDTLHYRIEECEYQINQNNLATLYAITEGEFGESLEHRYVRFQTVDGNLQNDLFVDQFFQLAHGSPTNYKIRVHYLPGNETTTLFFLLDMPSSEEKLNSKLQTNNYAYRQISDCSIPESEHVSCRSPFVISKPVSSNLIYYRLPCEYSFEAGVEAEWGGNDGVQTRGYVEGKAYDDRGNYVRGSYERSGDRNRMTGNVGYDNKRREREDH